MVIKFHIGKALVKSEALLNAIAGAAAAAAACCRHQPRRASRSSAAAAAVFVQPVVAQLWDHVLIIYY
jgi:hypothetical protein